MTPFQYEIALRPGFVGEYIITEEGPKYAGLDADDFEVVCTSPPGNKYDMRLNVYWSDIAAEGQPVTHSDAFEICFHKPGGRRPDLILVE